MMEDEYYDYGNVKVKQRNKTGNLHTKRKSKNCYRSGNTSKSKKLSRVLFEEYWGDSAY